MIGEQIDSDRGQILGVGLEITINKIRKVNRYNR